MSIYIENESEDAKKFTYQFRTLEEIEKRLARSAKPTKAELQEEINQMVQESLARGEVTLERRSKRKVGRNGR